jgi:DNA (cytosine-5)-methyltransferase 1
MIKRMRVGSLFAGIGGLELGLERAGVGRTIWQVEKDPFCRSVLAKHWPNAARFDDVRSVGAANLPYAEVICGGFPCTDISFAGKGAGLEGKESGLWFEFARIVREMGPRFVVVENVAALRSRGLGAVLGTLASLGYDAEWHSVRASDVGAPHRRDRVFVLAYANGNGPLESQGREQGERGRLGDGSEAVADARCVVCEREGERRDLRGTARAAKGPSNQWERDGNTARDRGEAVADADDAGRNKRAGTFADGGGFAESANASLPTRRKPEPVVGRGVDGLSAGLDRWPARPGEEQASWEPPRTIDKTPRIKPGGVRPYPTHAARLRALGNAVVPAVAEEIGRLLLSLCDASS